MIDWTQLKGFDWDAGNSRKSVEKHDVDQGEAEQVFLNAPLLVLQDRWHSGVEPRLHALGHTDDGRRLYISVTMRAGGSLLRVISTRDMSRKERKIYAEKA